MLSRYLLDTNTASYIIKGSIPAVERRLVKVPIAQIAISAVTEGELRYGVARQLRATLEREGHPMGSLDMMIGAQALASGLVLVTNDQAFHRIKKLKVEDWTKT